MTRHFGNPSGRPVLGGTSNRPSAYRAETPRELHPLPAHSIYGEPDPFMDEKDALLGGPLFVLWVLSLFGPAAIGLGLVLVSIGVWLNLQ